MSLYYGWWIVLACFLFGFYVSGTIMMGFTAFFEPIVEEFGWSYTQISLGASLRGLELGLLAPLVGFLVDRFGARRLLFSGSLFIAAGFLLLAKTNSLAMFYGGFILIGLGTSSCTGTVLMPAVANWFRKDVGKALGIMNTGMGAGGILLPLITMLIDSLQWRTAFGLLALGMLALGIPLSFVVRHTPEQYGYLPDGEVPPRAGDTGPGEERDTGLKTALKTKVFWYLSTSELIRLMTLSALVTHIMPYLSSIGIGRNRATFFAASIPLLSIVGRVSFGWMSDWYNRYYVMGILYSLGGIGVFFLAHADRNWPLVLFLICYPLSWGAPPLRGAILRESFGRLALGSIIGVLGGLATIARIVGPAVAGWSFDTFGTYYPVWLFFTCTFAVSVTLMFSLPRDGGGR
ncbi:MAG: MFS transporter [Deltaproteobacteria bacterium]|nr:MFS transporter [Deltaproteobacteria bacterium]MBW2138510.1 MFS transporter [Deltaproteobacteria bacterium]